MDFLDKVFGENWRDEKREWKQFQSRVKALPDEFRETYQAIQKYVYSTGLISNDWQPFVELLELFELTVEEGGSVQALVGPNVAEFCDAFFDRGKEHSDWLDKHRAALNDYFAKNGH